MYRLKYCVTKMNDTIYHIVKVSIQQIYHDTIQQSPRKYMENHIFFTNDIEIIQSLDH